MFWRSGTRATSGEHLAKSLITWLGQALSRAAVRRSLSCSGLISSPYESTRSSDLNPNLLPKAPPLNTINRSSVPPVNPLSVTQHVNLGEHFPTIAAG